MEEEGDEEDEDLAILPQSPSVLRPFALYFRSSELPETSGARPSYGSSGSSERMRARARTIKRLTVPNHSNDLQLTSLCYTSFLD